MDDFWAYIKAMEAIQAEEIQIQSRVVSVPHMDKRHRDSFIKEIDKKARIHLGETPTISIADADRLING